MKPGEMQSDPFKRLVKYKQHKVGTWKLHEIIGVPLNNLRDILMSKTRKGAA